MPTSSASPNTAHYDLAALGVPGTAAMSAELANLLDEHHDLDTVITVLLEAGSDDLLVNRFKKRKLQVKDQIAAAVVQIQSHRLTARAA